MLRDDTTDTPTPYAEPPTAASAPEADAPLDPAVERVRARVARLMLVGIGTLLLGVLAIAIVVFYRFGREPSTPVGSGDVTVPMIAGATLENATLAPNGLLLRFAMPGGDTQLVVLDPATGTPRLRVTLETDQGAAD